MSVHAWMLLGAVLAVNLYCRLQAERHRVDRRGRPVRFRWRNLRLHPREFYPTVSGRYYRKAAIYATVFFMLAAVMLMLRGSGGGTA